MLKILKNVFDAIISHAERDLPIEACGYLAGRDGVVRRHYELKNMDRSGIHFTFDPQEQFDAIKDMRASGLKPRAVYHSHPTTPARPSEEDIRLAYDQTISYVIISLNGGHPVTKSFKIKKNEVEQEEICTIMKTYKLDITKDQCPITFVKVKIQLAKMKQGERLEILLSKGEPLKNVPRSAEEQGHKLIETKPEGEFYKVLIEK